MQTKSFKPSPQYVTKLWLIFTVVAMLILISGVLIAWLISNDSDIGAGGARLVAIIIAAVDLVWWIPAMVLARPYYRSLRYEIQDDEVIVHVGIWTKSVKHVPYRTVTNLTVKRDILDRWFFGLGTLNIQTAGMSGTTGAEESLVGLTNVQELYEIVVAELRRFRGSMAPTAAEMEGAAALTSTVVPTVASADALPAILAEVRAIRQVLEMD
jgi:membrane protein YdbS with pleckstrin-like domain